MLNINEKIANLSAEQRALLESLLAEEGEIDNDADTLEPPLIVPAPEQRYEPFPLTEIQQAQLLGRSGLFDLTTTGHAYVELDCDGMDLERLTLALRRLIANNDQLRMVVIPGMRQQVLKEVPPYEIRVLDLRGKSQTEVDSGLLATREEMSRQILPADIWPIYEVRATRMDGDRLRLHVNFDLIVGDAWCFRMLLDEWAKLYDDPEAARPPLDLSYRDYVLALESLEGSALFERDLEYWRRHLAELPPPPQIPLAKSPAMLSKHRPQHWFARLEATEWERLKRKINRAQLTPSGFFVAALSEVLTVWSKSPRFALNVTVFNRLPLHPQVNDILVGEFNSFLLLAIDNSPQIPFVERARKLQEQLWEHLEHRWVSGVRLMRELVRLRGASPGETLMPVVFTSTLAHHEGEGEIPTRIPGKWVYETSQTAQVWMENHLWEENGELLLHVDIVDGLFPQDMFTDLFSAYVELLHRLSADDAAWQQPNGRYLIPERQRLQWQEFNATEATLPEGLLHSGFLAQAARRPEQPAVISARGSLSYGRLDRLSNRLGHWLRTQGAGPNELVAIVMRKGWEQVVAALAILKAGAAYLPIDPDVPAERLHYLLRNGAVRLALTQSELEPVLNWPAGVQPLAVDGTDLSALDDSALDPRQTPADIAYVIYTSGSTGQPKGVVIDHRGAVNTIADINTRFQVGPTDRVLGLSALHFDLSVYDLFGVLAAGGTLVLPAAGEPDPAAWLEWLQRERITLWNSVPALLELLLTHAEGLGVDLPATLRLALLSGDWIPLGLPERVQALRPGLELIGLGGATEASIWSIYYPITTVDPAWRSIPYGRPLHNQQVLVLDEALEPCPLWVPGQLYIGGVGVAQGYWRDDEKTRAAFITHPRSGRRLYRTGDLGRLLPTGVIEFLGREDFQVKVRGHRIELGEIEETLRKHPAVRAAVVTATGDDSESRQLIAYVVGPTESEPTNEELSGFLREKLPDYLVPRTFVHLESLPLTPNGKVDRKNLPAPGQAGAAATQHAYEAPRNPTEETLAALWAQVLNLEKIGIHDDFFQLGGNSLIASRLLYRIHNAFQVEVPLSALFEATTIAKAAQLIEQLLIEQIEQMTDEKAGELLAEEA
ncbi:MAG: amino acid adenylation domain-containing protein [Candidatus Competibacteraceae bacterium]